MEVKSSLKTLVLFVFFGLLFVSVPEYTNLIYINKVPEVFFGAMVFYTIALIIGFYIQKVMEKLITNQKILVLALFLLFGFFGLMFEWFIIGNGPGSDAIHVTMFTYWAGLFLMPRIITDTRKRAQKITILTRNVLLGYLVFHLVITHTVPFNYVILAIPVILWTAAYLAFTILYYQYSKI